MADAFKVDDYTTLDLVETDGSTSTPVAGIQNVTIIPSMSLENLFTADSIKREEVLQHEFVCQVEIGYSLWDVALIKNWLDGQGGSTSTSLTDTSDPQKFELTLTLPSVRSNSVLGGDVSGDGTDQPVTVKNIVFEEMPLVDASRGEWIQWDLSGEGDDITQVETA